MPGEAAACDALVSCGGTSLDMAHLPHDKVITIS